VSLNPFFRVGAEFCQAVVPVDSWRSQCATVYILMLCRFGVLAWRPSALSGSALKGRKDGRAHYHLHLACTPEKMCLVVTVAASSTRATYESTLCSVFTLWQHPMSFISVEPQSRVVLESHNNILLAQFDTQLSIVADRYLAFFQERSINFATIHTPYTNHSIFRKSIEAT
jgi:hypothetical protein